MTYTQQGMVEQVVGKFYNHDSLSDEKNRQIQLRASFFIKSLANFLRTITRFSFVIKNVTLIYSANIFFVFLAVYQCLPDVIL